MEPPPCEIRYLKFMASAQRRLPQERAALPGAP